MYKTERTEKMKMYKRECKTAWSVSENKTTGGGVYDEVKCEEMNFRQSRNGTRRHADQVLSVFACQRASSSDGER